MQHEVQGDLPRGGIHGAHRVGPCQGHGLLRPGHRAPGLRLRDGAQPRDRVRDDDLHVVVESCAAERGDRHPVALVRSETRPAQHHAAQVRAQVLDPLNLQLTDRNGVDRGLTGGALHGVSYWVLAPRAPVVAAGCMPRRVRTESRISPPRTARLDSSEEDSPWVCSTPPLRYTGGAQSCAGVQL